MFQDCFGTQLREGDDVLVSLGRNHLHCGFVAEIFVIIDYLGIIFVRGRICPGSPFSFFMEFIFSKESFLLSLQWTQSQAEKGGGAQSSPGSLFYRGLRPPFLYCPNFDKNQYSRVVNFDKSWVFLSYFCWNIHLNSDKMQNSNAGNPIRWYFIY